MSFTASHRMVNKSITINGVALTKPVKNIRFYNSVNDSSDNLLPGCAACATVEIVVKGLFLEDLHGQRAEIAFSSGSEGASIGVFYITEHAFNPSSRVTTLRASDVMSKLDGEDYISALTYPATVSDVLNEISELLGITISAPTSEIQISSKPTGYSCREIVGYIAGMLGGFAIASGDTIVIRSYTNTSKNIASSQIHMDGLKLKTAIACTTLPTVYVESELTGAPGKDVGYLQNPDDLAGFEQLPCTPTIAYPGGLMPNPYTPYWIIFEHTNVEINSTTGAPEYVVYFLRSNEITDEKAIFTEELYEGIFYTEYRFNYSQHHQGQLFNYSRLDNKEQTGDQNNEYNGTYFARPSQCYDWIDGLESLSSYSWIQYTYRPGSTSYYGQAAQHWQIVGSSIDVYLSDGTLFFAENGEYVGSLRGGGGSAGTGSGTELHYGSGDYTNPLIDSGNLEACQAMQNTLTYYPGEVKWRGDPTVEVGSAITVTSKSGVSVPFLISSQEIVYDGGMYAVSECHGSDKTFDKTPGIERNFKQLRGLKKLWAAMNSMEVT